MIHRACLSDDGRGVGESLNEKQFGQGIVVHGKHFLIIGPKSGDGKKSLAAIKRDVAQRKLLAPWPFITKKDLHIELNNLQFSYLKTSLPYNVQILTLEPWGENTLLLRLEHVLEKDEDDTLSQNVTIDLTDLFIKFSIIDLKETTLGGNVPIKESKRFSWPGSKNIEIAGLNENFEELRVTLTPMQIRTFVITVKYF